MTNAMSLVLIAMSLVLVPVAYGWMATHAPTARHPSVRWLTRGAPKTRRVVVCGASITHGRLSHDWVAELEGRLGHTWAFLNTGRNARRASDVRRWTRVAALWRPDVAIVMVGVNDALAGSSIDRYREELRKIVAQLNPARVALCTLTVLGDDPDGDAACRQAPYNDAIRAVAQEAGADLLDVAHAQIAWLRANPPAAPRPLRQYAPLMASSIAQAYLLGRSWDQISRAHGLALTTDLVHQNRAGGAIIAEQVERFLRALDGDAPTMCGRPSPDTRPRRHHAPLCALPHRPRHPGWMRGRTVRWRQHHRPWRGQGPRQGRLPGPV
jgi:lysophospholipase L1-like esterase